MRRIGKSFLLICMMLYCFALYGVEFSTELNQSKISINEYAIIKILVEDADDVYPESIPSVSGVAVEYAGSGSESGFGTGGSFSAVFLKFRVSSKKTGVYSIPPITFIVDGKRYQSSVLQITVENTKSRNSRNHRTIDPFDPFSIFDTMKSEPRDEIYLTAEKTLSRDVISTGESTILRYYLVTDPGVEYSIEGLRQDDWSGFILKPLKEKIKPVPIVKDARDLVRRHIASYRLIPAVSGNYTLDKDFIQLIFIDTNSRFSFRQKAILQLNQVTLDVLPLKEANKPKNFSGNFGDFNIKYYPKKIIDAQKNQDVSITVTVSGDGEFSQLIAPDFENQADITLFLSETKKNYSFNGITEVGSIEYVYTLVPKKIGLITIYPKPFSFYNPKTDTYSKQNGSPISIDVRAEDLVVDDEIDDEVHKEKIYSPLIAVSIMVCVLMLLGGVFVIYREAKRNRDFNDKNNGKKSNKNKKLSSITIKTAHLDPLYLIKLENAFLSGDTKQCYKELFIVTRYILKEKQVLGEKRVRIEKLENYLRTSQYGGGTLSYEFLKNARSEVESYLMY